MFKIIKCSITILITILFIASTQAASLDVANPKMFSGVIKGASEVLPYIYMTASGDSPAKPNIIYASQSLQSMKFSVAMLPNTTTDIVLFDLSNTIFLCDFKAKMDAYGYVIVQLINSFSTCAISGDPNSNTLVIKLT